MSNKIGENNLKGSAGKGRPKGSPNKSTARAREAIALFCEQNIPNMQKWLEGIAQTDGDLAAFKCTLEMMEYYVPKLARTEHVGDETQPIVNVVKFED